MKYRKLGASDLEVSEISLGSWMTFSLGVPIGHARALTNAAFDVGINFFDTANVYGRGAAEVACGEVLSDHPREEYVLATKVWGQMSVDQADHGLSAAQIAKQIDASLTRLRTDYVDLYQAHRFDPDVPIEETIEALQKVVADGKARYLGFSEWTPEQIQAAIDIGGTGFFISSQPQYSMLWQAPEAEIFPLCAAHEISQVVWSPLAQGLLTGKYRAGQPPPAGSRAASSETNGSMSLVMNEATIDAVGRLRPIAGQAGLSVAELALAWVLRRPEVASAISGASRPEQVHANVRASGIELTPDTLAAIDEALGDAPVKEPMLAPLARPGVTRRWRPPADRVADGPASARPIAAPHRRSARDGTSAEGSALQAGRPRIPERPAYQHGAVANSRRPRQPARQQVPRKPGTRRGTKAPFPARRPWRYTWGWRWGL